MLDKSMYESWKSYMEIYIQGKDYGRIILNSFKNGPLIWPTVEQENGIVRPKTYEELSDKEKLQADCHLKATNIVLQSMSLLKQKRECKLYDEFDKFSHVKGETLYEYYLRFAQLINNMNIIQMTMQPVQVNTKFLKSLSPEWSKFVTDVNRIINQEEIRQVTAHDEKWVPTKERVKISTTNGMFYKENIDYPKFIWEDFAFQINNRQLKKGRREIMPYPRISEDFQEYRLPILETMLTEGIKQSESYHIFIKYSTGLNAHKKIRGKGSQGKKTADTLEATVDVSEESNYKPARKRTSSRRVINKKVLISADDNIIPELESLWKELAADTMQALKESKKISRRQPNIRGSSEGTGSIPGVPNESTVVFSPSSEGTITKPGVPEEEKVTYEAKIVVTLDWGSEDEREYTEENDDDKNIEWVDIDEEEEKNDDDNDKHIDLENCRY
ncbi:hypothetical protein Tco_0847300 [Tanacetum coccineum]